MTLMERIGRVPKPHASIAIRRTPGLEDDEYDVRYKASQSRRRVPESATSPVIRTISPSWSTYGPDKKSSTGFAGLSNQGATCYMNSLIQGLFMTPEFRTAVYNWSFIDHLASRVAKLKISPDARKNAKDDEDMSWVDYADEIMALYTAVDQDTSNSSTPTPSSADTSSGETGTSTPVSSATPTPTTLPAFESEEAFESKFLKAARAQSMTLHAHAVNFEKWKRRVEALSIPFQLRLLFANLQLSEQRAVSTKGLTKSFGWTGADAFTQHDVQELLRVLFDALETAWDGTPQHSLINDLYQGSVLDYVKCAHCGYKSARRDTYLDLQLTVKPFGEMTAVKSVEEALEKYVQPEHLEGDNQYFCTQCDCKRDATKGLEFSSFPYLLTLQLKRFDFDWETERRIKLSDRVTFPSALDLNKLIPSEENLSRGSTSSPSSSGLSSGPSTELVDAWAQVKCPEPYSIRPAAPSDSTSILNLVRGSFATETESGVVEVLSKALPNSHLISLVAVDNRDQVVGHVMFSAVTLYASPDGLEINIKEPSRPFGRSALSAQQLERVPKLFGLAPLAVSVMHQKKGIAAALVTAGLQQLLSWGAKAVFVLGDIHYYSRFGFVPASRFGINYDTMPSSDNWMVIELAQGALSGCPPSFGKFCPGFDAALEFGKNRVASASATKDEFEDENHKDEIQLEEVRGPSWNQVMHDAYSYRHSLQCTDEPAFSVLPTSTAMEATLKAGPWVYELFAIFVHRGSATGGHYFAYIKDFEKDKWFEFNDSVVSEVTEDTVKSAYGGDTGAYNVNSGSSAYMMLYRQYDSNRNEKYPSPSDIPKEVAEAMEKERKRRVAKENLKRIEAQKVSMTVSYRGSRKDIRLHPGQPILDALRMAIEAFQVTAPVDNTRFHSTSQFLRPEEPSLWDLATPISAFSRDNIAQVQLQVRQPGKDFAPFDPKAVLFLVNVWNSETGSWPAESYEVYLPPRPELGVLRDRIASEFGIPRELQLITKEKNSAQPVEEVTGEDSRSFGTFSLWEKSTLWVEPYSESLIDQKYRPTRRKRLVTSYASSKATQYKSPITSGSSSPSVATSSARPSEINSSGEMDITPFGFEDDEPSSSTEATNAVEPEPEKKDDADDGYEEFYDPKFIYRNGHRIVPRSEDFVRNAQNRLVVRFTNLDGSEVVHSIPASRTDKISALRDRIAQVLKIDPMSFVILKIFSDIELNDSEATIDNFCYGVITSFRIRRGTPSLRGESQIKIESYVLDGPTGSTRKPLFEPQDWYTAVERLTVKDAKPQIRKLVGLDASIPLDHIRIRKPGPPSSFEGLASNIASDGQRLTFLGERLLVQVLDGPEPKQNEYSKVIVLRQVFPDRWELGPAIEMCVPAGGTFGEVRDYCAKISGLSSVQCVNRMIYHLPQIADLGGLDWTGYEARAERAIGGSMSDGDHVYFKDADVPFRELSEEEKRKLPKAKSAISSSSTYSRHSERALTIKVDDSS